VETVEGKGIHTTDSLVSPAAATAMISILLQVIYLSNPKRSRNFWIPFDRSVDLVRFFVGLGSGSASQERLLGFALGSVSMGGYVLHQRRSIYRILAETEGTTYSYQVSVSLLPPSLLSRFMA
jgi:hypothetical protein